MSWEEDFRRRYPCPCGKGEYVEIHRSDDWFRYETHYEMLCPKCKELYVYSTENIRKGCKPGHEIDRGWVLKSVLQAEQKIEKEITEKLRKDREQILKKAKELYYGIWTEKFTALKTKKDMHRILNYNGSYESFCKATRNYTRLELLEYINTYFKYRNLKQVFKVCDVDTPDWSYLGASDEYIKEIMENSVVYL